MKYVVSTPPEMSPFFSSQAQYHLCPDLKMMNDSSRRPNTDLKTTQTNASVNHVVTKLQLDAILDKDVYQHFVRMKFRALRTHSSVFSYSLIYYYYFLDRISSNGVCAS